MASDFQLSQRRPEGPPQPHPAPPATPRRRAGRRHTLLPVDLPRELFQWKSCIPPDSFSTFAYQAFLRPPCDTNQYSGFSRSSLLTKKQDQAARKIMRFLRRCRHRYISPRLCTLLITTNKQPCSSEPLINSDIKPPPPPPAPSNQTNPRTLPRDSRAHSLGTHCCCWKALGCSRPCWTQWARDSHASFSVSVQRKDSFTWTSFACHVPLQRVTSVPCCSMFFALNPYRANVCADRK